MPEPTAPNAAPPHQTQQPPRGQPPMNFRLTAILFGIVFVLGVVLLILSFRETENTPGGALTAELERAGVKEAKDVDAIEFERAGAEPLVIKRVGDKDRNAWQIEKPVAVPADASKVLPAITALLKAKPTAYTGLTGNPAVHGLDPVSLKVTLRAGDKASTVNLGDITLGDKGVVFVTTSSQSKRPMAVRRGDLDALFRELKDGKAGDLAKWTSDYRSSSVFPSDTRAAGEDVTAVRLELPNKKQAVALSRPAGGTWKFDSPAGWGDADTEGDAAAAPGTFTGVRRLLGALTGLTAATPADFIDQPKPLAEYGLDPGNPDLVKVEMKTRDNQSATVFIGKSEGAAAPKAPGAPADPAGKVFVRVEGQPGVIRATAGDLSGLRNVIADPAPLRDRTLVAVDRAKVDGIDIQLPGQPVTKLRRAGGPVWRLYGGPGDPQPAYGLAADKLLDVVLARRTIKDFPAPNPANFSAVAATVSVWADGFLPATDPKAEPTQKGQPVKLEFGNRAGDVVYVRRTAPGQPVGEFTLPAQVKVGAGTETADVLAAVAKSRLDLLDPSLPTFGSDAVASVAVTGASTYALAKDDKPDPSTREFLWRFTAPEPKGRVADARTVEGMLQLLGTTQSVTRFVDENPDAAKLAEYGFTPGPRLKVVVGLRPDAADKERVYEFGKDTSDPNFVFARVAGRTAVFTLPRLVLDRFVSPDLRDRVVFRAVPAGAVNKLVLEGWGNLFGNTPIRLALEKNKDGVWVVAPAAPGAPANAPPGFVVDPAKVAAFVELVARTPVKTFEKGRAEARHGFNNPNEYLAVQMEWGTGAVTFRLGAAADNGAGYFGETGWLPASDPVFTIDAGLFKAYKERPGGFAK